MKYLDTREEFIRKQRALTNRLGDPKYKERFYELLNHKTGSSQEKGYYIQVTLPEYESLLTEHKAVKNFQGTTNRYYFHPEDTNIPVKAHYHIIPRNGTTELYAVNLDGTAHHKANRGYKIPKKEATELANLGVNIPPDRILENASNEEIRILTENLQDSNSSIFILINPNS